MMLSFYSILRRASTAISVPFSLLSYLFMVMASPVKFSDCLFCQPFNLIISNFSSEEPLQEPYNNLSCCAQVLVRGEQESLQLSSSLWSRHEKIL